MSSILSFADLEGQHVELLPARTVLSLFSVIPRTGCNSTNTNVGTGSQTCTAGSGGYNYFNYNYYGTQTNSAGTGTSGTSGS